MSDSDANEIVDASGNPIQKQPTARGRVEKASRVGRGAILWTIGAIAVVGGLITNSGKIIDLFWPPQAEHNADTITVPNLLVKLRNTGDEQISLPVRGEYWLWPPGDGVQHYAGAYEFKEMDNRDIDAHMISVPAKGERAFLINLTNPALAGYLATGDYHIDFILRTDQNGRNMVWSGPIAFTEMAMSKGYVFDVFEPPDTETE